MNEPPTPERPEEGTRANPETERSDGPRIYVASLSDYNAGRLHGAWIDTTRDDEEIGAAITAMLARSPEPLAEEWAIHDHDGFGPLRLDEYESLEHVATIGRGIAEHGVAFAHWANYLGPSQWEHLEQFEDSFVGEWPTIHEFAESLLDDLGIDTDELGPELLRPYVSFDYDAFARDLSYDYHIAEDDDGIYVFDIT